MISDLLIEFWQSHRLLIFGTLLLNLIIFPLELIGISKISTNLSILLNKGVDQNLVLIWKMMFFLLFMFTIYAIVSLLEEYSDTKSIPKFEQFMRDKIIDPVLNQNAEALDNLETIRLLQNLNRTPKILSDVYERFNRYLIPFLILVISLTGYFFYCHWILGLVALVCFWCIL